VAAELVQLKVVVIVTLYVPPSLAAKKATREIPIVAIVGDPIETGIVSSLARPGGNITGVSLMASALHGKSVELFRDMLPSARRVGVLGHSANPVFAKAMLDEVLVAGGPTGLEIQPVIMIRGPDEFESPHHHGERSCRCRGRSGQLGSVLSGDCRSRWKRHSASRRWRMPWLVTASSTRTTKSPDPQHLALLRPQKMKMS